ncbi:DUF6086 family protein [Gloeocapsa sp. PCC 73106]|uniref:DUF6086 family protein n=1 Tax=Gloeocapsa sp. PCC 73106 TaxID=102232 RepID=UPI0002AC3D99|nr:DUF6086 family protein [Gloeocapsa sp. PCC 73106]ELR97132.1 hypothetical protein GLO73106DRAFT_00009370 [Gloeocapsa sp. PCC 73106]
MSVLIECNGKELWSPSLRVGNLFFDQLKALEKVLGLESGVYASLADTYKIDAVIFNTFVKKILQTLETTNNGPLYVLMAGCLEIAIALNAKITGEWPLVSERLNPLVLKAKTAMNAIPF